MDFLKRAEELKPELVAWRRTLHANPEIGFELPETTKFVWEQLCAMGYTPFHVGKAGIGALVGKPGKTFLLRGDMDALPMREESGLPFASQNGYAHTCGHDIHTSALLGAAKLLKEAEAELQGTVKLMFQPCEEGMGGAQDMVDAGILQNPRPDAALALHVVNEPLGTAGLRPGYACASCDTFTLAVHGIGCHGAAAYMGVDPLLAAANIILALQALNSREVAPDEMLVLTVCMLHGGDAPNVIPDTCVLRGTVRTAKEEVRIFAKKRLEEIARAASAVYRAQCDVEWSPYCVPPMVNDPALAQDVSFMIDALLGDGTAWEIPAMTGSEDFSVVGLSIPSALVWFGTGSKEENYPYGVHHPKVTFNEDAIPQMSAVYAYCAARWLDDQANTIRI